MIAKIFISMMVSCVSAFSNDVFKDQEFVRIDDSTQRQGIIVFRTFTQDSLELIIHATVISQKELLAEPQVTIVKLKKSGMKLYNLTTNKEWAELSGDNIVLVGGEKYKRSITEGSSP